MGICICISKVLLFVCRNIRNAICRRGNTNQTSEPGIGLIRSGSTAFAGGLMGLCKRGEQGNFLVATFDQPWGSGSFHVFGSTDECFRVSNINCRYVLCHWLPFLSHRDSIIAQGSIELCRTAGWP